MYGDISVKYFEKHKQYPDIIVLSNEEADRKEIRNFLRNNYKLDAEEKIGYIELEVCVKIDKV